MRFVGCSVYLQGYPAILNHAESVKNVSMLADIGNGTMNILYIIGKAGFMPYAMLYRDRDGIYDPDWRRFQRQWVRPQFVGARMKSVPLIFR